MSLDSESRVAHHGANSRGERFADATHEANQIDLKFESGPAMRTSLNLPTPVYVIVL